MNSLYLIANIYLAKFYSLQLSVSSTILIQPWTHLQLAGLGYPNTPLHYTACIVVTSFGGQFSRILRLKIYAIKSLSRQQLVTLV